MTCPRIQCQAQARKVLVAIDAAMGSGVRYGIFCGRSSVEGKRIVTCQDHLPPLRRIIGKVIAYQTAAATAAPIAIDSTSISQAYDPVSVPEAWLATMP